VAALPAATAIFAIPASILYMQSSSSDGTEQPDVARVRALISGGFVATVWKTISSWEFPKESQ
jgi:hypothetical protein